MNKYDTVASGNFSLYPTKGICLNASQVNHAIPDNWPIMDIKSMTGDFQRAKSSIKIRRKNEQQWFFTFTFSNKLTGLSTLKVIHTVFGAEWSHFNYWSIIIGKKLDLKFSSTVDHTWIDPGSSDQWSCFGKKIPWTLYSQFWNFMDFNMYCALQCMFSKQSLTCCNIYILLHVNIFLRMYINKLFWFWTKS